MRALQIAIANRQALRPRCPIQKKKISFSFSLKSYTRKILIILSFLRVSIRNSSQFSTKTDEANLFSIESGPVDAVIPTESRTNLKAEPLQIPGEPRPLGLDEALFQRPKPVERRQLRVGFR